MNSKQVLDKILTLLSLDKKEEVELTYAKLKDGTIVESATFDVGEDLSIVTEDGKEPAPDGEHELSLRDSSGNEVLIKVFTKDGKIVERENVELPKEEEMKAEEEKVKDIPQVDGVIGKEKKEEKMAEEEELPSGDGVEEEVDPLPEDEVDMKKMYEDMAYRIEELEKKIAKMEEAQPKVEEKKEEDVMEEDKTPKLDGAPIDEQKMSAVFSKTNRKSGVENAQDSFLAKLYK